MERACAFGGVGMWIMECQVKEGEFGQAQVIWREWRGAWFEDTTV